MKKAFYFIENFTSEKKNYCRTADFSTKKSLEDCTETALVNQTTNSFYVSTPSKMVYRDKSLFTQQYIEKIKEIVGDAKDYKKLTNYSRDLITKELEDLYDIETT